MKRLIKSLLRKLWQTTSFVRRPLARKLDSWIERVLDRALTRQLEGQLASLNRVESALARTDGFDRMTQDLGQLSQQVEVSREMSEHALGETSLLLDCLLREVSRLQLQMEEIQEQLVHSGSEDKGLNLLENDEDSTEAA